MEPYIVLSHNPQMQHIVDLKPDVEFACPDGERLALQLLRPLWPSENGRGFPLVVFIQGSAWHKPNQFWELPQLSMLARKGVVIASVTHRSCCTAKAPAFLQDVKCALRFLRAHAAEYDIDKSRVCAWGTSSGGNTALLMGLTGDDPAFETQDWAGESTAVQAVVDCFGPSDLVGLLEAHRATAEPGDEKLFEDLAGCAVLGCGGRSDSGRQKRAGSHQPPAAREGRRSAAALPAAARRRRPCGAIQRQPADVRKADRLRPRSASGARDGRAARGHFLEHGAARDYF